MFKEPEIDTNVDFIRLFLPMTLMLLSISTIKLDLKMGF